MKLRYNLIEQRCRKRLQSASASPISCFFVFVLLFKEFWKNIIVA